MPYTYPSGIFLGQFFYRSVPFNAGWSEKWWVAASTAEAAKDKLVLIRDARLGILSTETDMEYTRISKPDVRGDAFVNMVTPLTGNYPDAIPDDDSAPVHPSTALITRFETSEGKHSTHYIRGLTDDLFTLDGFTPPAGWNTLWDAFVDAVTLNAVMLVRSDGDPNVLEQKSIARVVQVRTTSRKVGRPFGLSRGRSAPPPG